MSIAGITVIIIYVCTLLYSISCGKMKKFRYSVFKLTIVGTMFINVGVAVFNKSFVFLFEILYLVTIILGGGVQDKKGCVDRIINECRMCFSQLCPSYHWSWPTISHSNV